MDNYNLVCIRTAPNPNPRIVRLVTVAEEVGLKTLYLGAVREKNLAKNEIVNDIPVQRLGRFYPMLNGQGLVTYILGTLLFNLAVFKFLIKTRPEIVHVSDVESFPCSILYKLIFRKKLLYNIHDNFSQRYSLPNFANNFLNFMEGVFVMLSSVTIVPEDFRARSLPGFCQGKIKIVRNSPMDLEVFLPQKITETEEIVIIYSGWIDSKRGVEELLKVADRIDGIRIIVVGEGDPKLIEIMKNHKKCDYRGFIPYKDSISLLKEAHFVYIHYSPERLINRFAAPNKLPESLAAGRIPIINSEIVLSKKVVDFDCGVVSSYGDEDSLYEKITALRKSPLKYQSMCTNARRLFDKEYSWVSIKASTVLALKEVNK